MSPRITPNGSSAMLKSGRERRPDPEGRQAMSSDDAPEFLALALERAQAEWEQLQAAIREAESDQDESRLAELRQQEPSAKFCVVAFDAMARAAAAERRVRKGGQ
jgi:hypothetical protein